MRKILTAIEMSEADRRTADEGGVPTIDLMENASAAVLRGIAVKLAKDFSESRSIVFCGKGNNGGDGLALARMLVGEGSVVAVLLAANGEELKGEALHNYLRLKEIESDYLRIEEFTDVEALEEILNAISDSDDQFEIIVDAVFGTGLTRPVEGFYAAVIEAISMIAEKSQNALRVAVDMPSGLDSDNPNPIGPHANADITVTFTAPKYANVLPPACRFGGELVIADIGTPSLLVDEIGGKDYVSDSGDSAKWLRAHEFAPSSHKNQRGTVLAIVGSQEFPGAAVLASNAAMRSGVGIVYSLVSDSGFHNFAARVMPEVMAVHGIETENNGLDEKNLSESAGIFRKADAILAGCGLRPCDDTDAFVRLLILTAICPLVLDAEALNAISRMAKIPETESPLILTPHPGEFARLTGEKCSDDYKERIEQAKHFAVDRGVFLVLKGERTLIAAPSGKVVLNPTGTPALGKAGNGDTLAGFLAGFVAQTWKAGGQGPEDIFEAIVAAVQIAGFAGEIAEEKLGSFVMNAGDVGECFAEAISRILESCNFKED
ncbi:MAG: NAD(P)H-hydrate dehydratase [Pyrinomonadaceae bacterium]